MSIYYTIQRGSFMRLVCVGEITQDRYLLQNLTTVGGISLNQAVHARRCGADVALISCIGSDQAGRAALELLRRAGIDASRVLQRAGETAHQDIVITPEGERIFPPGGYGSGVLADWALRPEDIAFTRDFDLVVAPYFSQVAHIFDAVMFDANPRIRRAADFLDWNELGGDTQRIERALPQLDVAFLSGNQQAIDLLEPLAQRHDCLMVVTLGAEGSVALARGQRYYQAALPVDQVVDTTGCGDAFAAAFLVRYMQDGNIPEALLAGAKQSASVVSKFGAC